MIIKICGIVPQDNYDELSQFEFDMIGINFYPKSKRFIGNRLLKTRQNHQRVGVFVKASVKEISDHVKKHNLDFVQLHGDQDSHFCKEVQKLIPVIKVFRVDETFDWLRTETFSFCDLFLFDTKAILYGGTGHKFDWKALTKYHGDVRFMLSGGIGPKDVESILKISHPKMLGIDINSKFESSPGIKDKELIERFIKEFRK